MELLVTITIIAILAGTMLFALQGAAEQAKTQKTKALIQKLNNIIMPRYENFQTRRLAINTQGLTPDNAAQLRLNALHKTMRWELPDRWTDITDNPFPANGANPNQVSSDLPALPANSLNAAYYQAYLNVVNSPPASGTPPANLVSYQGAECLYLIVSLGMQDELGGRELFNESNVGDFDNDGFKEFWDAWGNPISFIRWPAGFSSDLIGGGGVVTGGGSNSITTNAVLGNNLGGRQLSIYSPSNQTFQSATIQNAVYSSSSGTSTVNLSTALSNSPQSGDLFGIDAYAFDPRQVVFRFANTPEFAIYPLIYSAGPDGTFGMTTDIVQSGSPLHYANTGASSPGLPNNPFYSQSGVAIGTPANISSEQSLPNYQPSGWLDNIHNHHQGNK